MISNLENLYASALKAADAMSNNVVMDFILGAYEKQEKEVLIGGMSCLFGVPCREILILSVQLSCAI